MYTCTQCVWVRVDLFTMRARIEWNLSYTGGRNINKNTVKYDFFPHFSLMKSVRFSDSGYLMLLVEDVQDEGAALGQYPAPAYTPPTTPSPLPARHQADTAIALCTLVRSTGKCVVGERHTRHHDDETVSRLSSFHTVQSSFERDPVPTSVRFFVRSSATPRPFYPLNPFHTYTFVSPPHNWTFLSRTRLAVRTKRCPRTLRPDNDVDVWPFTRLT